MTEWLLLTIYLTGKSAIAIDAMNVTRHPTQERCEQVGAADKKASKKRASFVCFEVAKFKR